MKQLVVFLGVLILSLPVSADDSACLTQAHDRKLAGAALSSYMQKCVRDSCETASQEKKLAGAARNSFTKKCTAEGLMAYCEERAAAKKLSGAARTSFMTKCQSGS